MSERPYYDKAREALDAAHKACFNHPDRGVLGMSSGPFSGVNVALGIIATLERENAILAKREAKPVPAEIAALVRRLRKPASVTVIDGDPDNAGKMRKLCQADQALRDEAAEAFVALSAALRAASQPAEAKATYTEQPDFIHFECPECGFTSVQKSDFKGPTACPMCTGDSGHDVGMHKRVARSTDKPEGRDARAETKGR